MPAQNSSHIIVLNKYPIIAEHFILATKENKPQTNRLEIDDLQIAYQCLKEWQGQTHDGQPKRLFAFFNSGEHSGASQPHRHLQFLPVEDMQGGEAGRGWSLLADSIWAGEDIGRVSVKLHYSLTDVVHQEQQLSEATLIYRSYTLDKDYLLGLWELIC